MRGVAERQKEKEIDGVLYRARPVGFGVGLSGLMRLVKILSPILASALREAVTDRMRIAAILETLPHVLTEADVRYFAELFGTASEAFDPEAVEGAGAWLPLIKTQKMDKQEEHFGGRYMAFVKWLGFCIEVNYGGFFDGMTSVDGAALTSFLTKAKAGAGAPSASTAGNGSAGES